MRHLYDLDKIRQGLAISDTAINQLASPLTAWTPCIKFWASSIKMCAIRSLPWESRVKGISVGILGIAVMVLGLCMLKKRSNQLKAKRSDEDLSRIEYNSTAENVRILEGAVLLMSKKVVRQANSRVTRLIRLGLFQMLRESW